MNISTYIDEFFKKKQYMPYDLKTTKNLILLGSKDFTLVKQDGFNCESE